LGPSILLSTLFANTLSLCSPHNIIPSFTPIQKYRRNCNFVYFHLYVFW
jgi:hypothetical protein